MGYTSIMLQCYVLQNNSTEESVMFIIHKTQAHIQRVLNDDATVL